MSQRIVTNMKVGIAVFFLGLALIHKSVAKSLEAGNEPDDAGRVPPLDGKVPDGIIRIYGDELANLNEKFTSNYSKLLEHVSIVMKKCTTEKCNQFSQCNKFGEHVICIAIDIFDLGDFFGVKGVNPEEDHEYGIVDDNEDVHDAEKEAQMIRGKQQTIKFRK